MKLFSTISLRLNNNWVWLFTLSLIVTREVNLTKLAGLSTVNNYIDALISPAFLVLLVYLIVAHYKLFLNSYVQIFLICSVLVAFPTSFGEWYSWLVRVVVLLGWLSVSRESWNKLWLAILPIALFDHVLLSSVYPVFIVLWLQLISSQKLFEIVAPVALLHGVVAVVQTCTGASLGLYWLGEKYLDLQTKGVAKTVWSDWIILRGYGLFAHPIILGFMGLAISAFCTSKHKICGVLLALLSQSRAVYIGLIGFYKVSYKWILMLLFTIALLFIIRIAGSDIYRFADFKNYLQHLQDHPATIITGVGAGQFPHFLKNHYTLADFQYQPVHSVVLLLLSELGIPLAITYLLILKKQIQK